MTSTPITIADIALFASVAAAVAGIVFQLLRFAMTFLTAKFAPLSKAEKLAQEQSEQCRFDHAGINALIATQNANIAKMLEQNGEQIKALSDANHAAQLRHQIVLSKLERIEDRLPPSGSMTVSR